MAERIKLPIGVDLFKKMREDGFFYIDKTRLIEQLLENGGEVNLFTRPRRFGKTLRRKYRSDREISEPNAEQFHQRVRYKSAGERKGKLLSYSSGWTAHRKFRLVGKIERGSRRRLLGYYCRTGRSRCRNYLRVEICKGSIRFGESL